MGQRRVCAVGARSGLGRSERHASAPQLGARDVSFVAGRLLYIQGTEAPIMIQLAPAIVAMMILSAGLFALGSRIACRVRPRTAGRNLLFFNSLYEFTV